MPHKLDYKYRSYDTPYGESYSVDTKLWYDDGKEEFPQPQAKAELIDDFSITPLFGISDWDDEYGGCGNDIDSLKLMIDVCFEKGYDDAYSFGWYAMWGGKKVLFAWQYHYNKRNVTKFLNKIRKNQFSSFYTDCYNDYKIFSYPFDNSKIRLVIQDYNEESPTFLKNIFDGLVDKEYFVLSLSSLVKNAEEYLLDYVYAYAKENNITGEALDKAIKIAKDKI